MRQDDTGLGHNGRPKPAAAAHRRRIIGIALALAGYWMGLLIPLVSYVLYPVTGALAARLRPPAGDAGPWPSVTMAIEPSVAVTDEVGTLGRAFVSMHRALEAR